MSKELHIHFNCWRNTVAFQLYRC